MTAKTVIAIPRKHLKFTRSWLYNSYMKPHASRKIACKRKTFAICKYLFTEDLSMPKIPA